MLGTMLAVLFTHWVADFVCQSRWMGENKSHDWSAMSLHILTYAYVSFISLLILIHHSATYTNIVAFVLFNSIAHLCTDTITSRITSYAFKNSKMHLFWATIGFDQFAHTAVLVGTMPVFLF